MSFEDNQAVFGFFGHCHPYKELTLTIMSKCWSYTLQPSDPDAKYWLTKFRHAQKAKFRVGFNQ